jgi:protein phosphatase
MIFLKKFLRPPSEARAGLFLTAASGIFLLPSLQSSLALLTWLLLAVIASLLIIFILIAFILRPLSRRSRSKPATQPPSSKPPPPQIDPDIATVPTAPVTDSQERILTQVSLPASSATTTVTVPATEQRPAGINWHIAGVTDVGLKRELNEDALLITEAAAEEIGPYGLYVVADGLGGHEAGEIASQITVDTIQRWFEQKPPTIDINAPKNWFEEVIYAANEAVVEYQNMHKEAQKMGSTLVMALVTPSQIFVTHVGDSRAYLLTQETIQQITVDHSLVERLVQIGQISREEARTHKQRNVVYSIIGEKRRLEIGYYQLSLAPGDRLLLCSDGLTGLVTDDEILRLSQQESDLAQAGQAMIEAAKAAGGHDNITTVLLEMNRK